MRIIGDIDDTNMKITILEMNHRVSLKFEFDLMEQTYKLNEGFEGNVVEILTERLTSNVRKAILDKFMEMRSVRHMISEIQPEDDEEFPQII